MASRVKLAAGSFLHFANSKGYHLDKDFAALHDLDPLDGIDLFAWHFKGWLGASALTNEAVKTGKPLDGFSMEDCLADGQPDEGPKSKMQNWFARLFNVTNATFRRCIFRRVNREHPLYLNAYGSMLFEDLFFEDNGSQGLQLAFRFAETFDPNLAKTPGLQVFRRLRFERCGLKRGRRPAFALSIHAAQGTPRIEAAVLMEDLSFWHRDGFACLLVERRPSLVVRELDIHYGSTAGSGKPRGEVVLIRDVDDVLFESSNVHVEKGPGAVKFEGCKRVTLRGCTGNVPVFVDGKNLGPIGSLELDGGAP